MSAQTLRSRTNRITKLKTLKMVELTQLRVRFDAIKQKHQKLEHILVDKNALLTKTLKSAIQNREAINCEHVQMVWRFAESLRNEISELKEEREKLASEAEQHQRQITLIHNQTERFSEMSNQMAAEIRAEREKWESLEIEDQISISYGRLTP